MAKTPNYQWPTPDDVRAFHNGATDDRALANAIDASMKALDTAYKSADAGITSAYKAADNAISDTATARWAGHGGSLTRAGSQSTASTSNDVTLAMDGVRDLRGTASGGASLSLVEAGLYVIMAQLEVGVGAGGEFSIAVRTGGGTALCASGGLRNGSLRALLTASATWSLGSSVVLSLKYSTSAAMTITGATLSAYRIGAS